MQTTTPVRPAPLPNGRQLTVGNQIPGAGYLPSGDHVKQRLEEAGANSEQLDTILWLLNYGRSQKLSSVSALARRLNVSSSTLGRVFAGKYGADLGSIASDIEHFRKVVTERKEFGEQPVLENLRVVEDITAFCDLTRASATMALLWGPNQSGKTWALDKIYTRRHNHGRTIFVRMPVGGGTRMFMEEVLRACSISERKSYIEMRQRVVKYFDPQTLFIVDEVHQAMIGRTMRTVTIETIREIHDSTGCGVVLCGTDVLPDMMDDPRFKKVLGQTGNRGVLRRRIPPTPYPEDIVALYQAYRFGKPESEAKELVKTIASTNGIGKLCKYFQMSCRLASKQKTPVTWDHFLQTHATLKSWERGEQMKRS